MGFSYYNQTYTTAEEYGSVNRDLCILKKLELIKKWYCSTCCIA